MKQKNKYLESAQRALEQLQAGDQAGDPDGAGGNQAGVLGSSGGSGSSGGMGEQEPALLDSYQKRVKQLQKENEELKVNGALHLALVQAGAKDPDYIAFQIKAIHPDLQLNNIGRVKGIEEIINKMNVKYPSLFGKGKSAKRRIIPNNLPGGSSDVLVTRDQFSKMGYNDRLKLKKEDPVRFSQLNKK